jgi:quercetin dioxygenase-like cupin family protein
MTANPESSGAALALYVRQALKRSTLDKAGGTMRVNMSTGATAGFAAFALLGSALVGSPAQGAEPASHSGPPPAIVATGNFVKADSLPWLLACEWADADGKFQNSWTEGLARPKPPAVPADALCTKVKRFSFPGDHTLLFTIFQKNRPTPVQNGRLTNFMYVLKGHGRSTVDGQTFETGPRDGFAQPAGKPHQTVALSDDYEQFDVVGIAAPPEGEGFKVKEADLARGDVLLHKDAPRSEVCMYGLTAGVYKSAAHGRDASMPDDAACFVVYSLLSRPGAGVIEVEAKKGTKTLPHAEKLGSIIYYVKGKVRATVGDETQVMTAGDATVHPGGGLHADEFLEDTIQLEIRYPQPGKGP